MRRSLIFFDHYKTLGVPRDASKQQIKDAFRRLAKLYHPDLNASAQAKELFGKALTAYEILTSEERKRVYDSRLGNVDGFGHSPTCQNLVLLEYACCHLRQCRRCRNVGGNRPMSRISCSHYIIITVYLKC